VTGNDPTDQALAVIASIFDRPAPKPEPHGEEGPDASARDAAMHGDGAVDAPDNDEPRESVAAIERITAVKIETIEIVDVSVAPAADAEHEHAHEHAHEHEHEHEDQPEPTVAAAVSDDGPEDLDALTRHGPGPLEALRFRWSVRRGDDGYYVDETIGTASQPITTGPLSRAEAIGFIDTRERRTRQRFERLRNEIISGPSERGDEDDDSEL